MNAGPRNRWRRGVRRALLSCLAMVVWWPGAEGAESGPPAPAQAAAPAPLSARELRLVTVAPGHFHAALFQKEMLPGLSAQAYVYAPLGPELIAHLSRLTLFSTRTNHPAPWRLDVRAGPDYWERFLAERPGDLVVLSGNNRGKIDRLDASVRAGLHVLADKPWIIEPEEMPKLAQALEAAEKQGVIAYDAMTQRYEISCLLPRALVHDPAVFGEIREGSATEPAVEMESVHYLLKEAAGVPTLRPAWFFDVRQQGEGLTDVGTHLVDLVPWTLFPDQALDYRADIRVAEANHWPTLLPRAEFRRVTGEKDFPEYLARAVQGDRLEYFCNNSILYWLRGVAVRLTVKWEFAPPAGGGDTEAAVFRGSKSRVEVRQGPETRYLPEVFVVPQRPELAGEIRAALQARVRALQPAYQGLGVRPEGPPWRLIIPDSLRVGHEAHFGLLVWQFLAYVKNPALLPAWEKPNLLAKYYVTTQGVQRARQRRAGQSLQP